MGNITYPTTRQRESVEKIMQGKSVSKAMRESGYDDTTAKNPKNLTESKGFKQLCEENGLTENLLVRALVSDIQEKPKNRKAELELGFKVIGKLDEKPEGNKTLVVVISGASAKRYNIDGAN